MKKAPQYRFEYHGNLSVERIEIIEDGSTRSDWIYFDTADEAIEFFNTVCEI